MNKIFEKAIELHVRAVTLYYKSTDGILYYDAAFTSGNEVTKDELARLFLIGAVVVDDGTNLVRPTTYTASTNYSYVTYTSVGESAKAVATSFYSKGYVAG